MVHSARDVLESMGGIACLLVMLPKLLIESEEAIRFLGVQILNQKTDSGDTNNNSVYIVRRGSGKNDENDNSDNNDNENDKMNHKVRDRVKNKVRVSDRNRFSNPNLNNPYNPVLNPYRIPTY
jgi:hypothetical protein